MAGKYERRHGDSASSAKSLATSQNAEDKPGQSIAQSAGSVISYSSPALAAPSDLTTQFLSPSLPPQSPSSHFPSQIPSSSLPSAPLVQMQAAEPPSFLSTLPSASLGTAQTKNSLRVVSGHPKRTVRLSKRYRDEFPQPPAPVADSAESRLPVVQRVALHAHDTICMATNAFGILQKYPHRPSYDPDAFVVPDDLSYKRRQPPEPMTHPNEEPAPELPPPWPFPNMTTYQLMQWRYSGSIVKSQQEVNRLVKNILLANDFKAGDLQNFSVAMQNLTLDTHCSNSTQSSDSWQEVNMNIEVSTGIPSTSGSYHQSFTISSLLYRPLVDVIKSAFSSPYTQYFHIFPFKHLWKHPVDGTEQRVFDKLYTSDAWLKAHDNLQKQPNKPNCKLDKVITAIMFLSDTTTLATFGTAKAWPLYLFFGNLSKYIRARPSAGETTLERSSLRLPKDSRRLGADSKEACQANKSPSCSALGENTKRTRLEFSGGSIEP
ncbi:hypothetical protein HD554DRAFT_2167335 [Boletus coccyginus]|nr:hypothetical protein HD554DRAFT_2167335 [Boletus coccyginus]